MIKSIKLLLMMVLSSPYLFSFFSFFFLAQVKEAYSSDNRKTQIIEDINLYVLGKSAFVREEKTNWSSFLALLRNEISLENAYSESNDYDTRAWWRSHKRKRRFFRSTANANKKPFYDVKDNVLREVECGLSPLLRQTEGVNFMDHEISTTTRQRKITFLHLMRIKRRHRWASRPQKEKSPFLHVLTRKNP